MTDQESINILNSLIPPPISTTHHTVSFDLNKSDSNKNSNENGTSESQEKKNVPSGCPFFNGSNGIKPQKSNSINKKNPEWQTSVSIASEPVSYYDYLQLDKILDAQFPVSKKYGNMVHDEHLFIVVHQGIILEIIMSQKIILF
jgi:hypothetical protein